MHVYVEGVGLCGPGLDGWAVSQPILAGEQHYTSAPTRAPPSELLPANERRRAPEIVRIALAVGAEAFAAAKRDPTEVPSIFTSSGGDGETIHGILSVLASPRREVSPTRFHNSVHNTAAGYWSIATGSVAASTSICCYDDSFAAGLLEAAAQVAVTQAPVALVAYDVRYPAPLDEVRPIGAAFAVALVLSAEPAAVRPRIELMLNPESAIPSAAAPDLETLRQNTPAARCLPLLAALTQRSATKVMLNYLDMGLALRVEPAAISAYKEDEPALFRQLG